MNFKDFILFENERLLAVNKPSGMLSIPDREGKETSLKDLLRTQYPEIYTVHRLDRETSGIILFAKTADAHKQLTKQFEERKTIKIYYGLVLGSLSLPQGSIDAPIAENMVRRGTMLVHRRGKPALTDYKVLKDFGRYSWVQFQIYTGRTHQIRVHAKQIGHPLVGDTVYGDGKPLLLSSFKNKFKLGKDVLEEKPLINRVALHASLLKINDEENNLLALEAPLQKDLKVTIAQLEKKIK